VRLKIPGTAEAQRLVDVFTGHEFACTRGVTEVTLDGYGFRWLRLTGADDPGLY
jgi:hypothetical protein